MHRSPQSLPLMAWKLRDPRLLRIFGRLYFGLRACLDLSILLFRGGVVVISSSPLSSSVPVTTAKQVVNTINTANSHWILTWGHWEIFNALSGRCLWFDGGRGPAGRRFYRFQFIVVDAWRHGKSLQSFRSWAFCSIIGGTVRRCWGRQWWSGWSQDVGSR